MYGFSPGSSESSLQSYIGYFVTLGEVLYDRDTKKPIRPTKNSVIKKHVLFITCVMILGTVASIYHHFNYKFFDIGIDHLNSFTISPFILLKPSHTLNNFSLGSELLQIIDKKCSTIVNSSLILQQTKNFCLSSYAALHRDFDSSPWNHS